MYKTFFVQHSSQFGDVPYNTWGLTITLAFILAAMVAHARAGKVGIDPDKLVGMYLLAVIGGLAGARLLHLAMSDDSKAFFANPAMFFNLSKGGFAFYGGFIAAGLASIGYARWQGIPTLKMADALGPTVMLGLAIGRVGCFMAGCCHGRAVEVPAGALALLPAAWGPQLWLVPGPPFLIEMMVDGVGENHVPVLATQVYEVVAATCIFALCSLAWAKWRKFDGQVIAMVLMLYALWRPFNESLRGDSVRGTGYHLLGVALSTSQLISVPVFLFGLGIALARFRYGVAPEKPFEARGPEGEGPDVGASAPRL